MIFFLIFVSGNKLATAIKMYDRILVVTLSNIGDVVMTTPVFETLHQVYPKALIDVVGDERSSALFVGMPFLGEIYHRKKKASFSEKIRFVLYLRQRKYDLIVDLRTNIIPFLLRGEKRLLKRARTGLSQHSVEEHMSTLSSLRSKDYKIPECKLYIGSEQEQEQEVGALLSSVPKGRWLAVAPGANWPGKKWPASRYQDLILQLDGIFDAILILGVEGDSLQVLETSRTPLFNFTGQTNLKEVKVISSQCSFFIGNDSGLGHVASGFGVPTLTLFGPGNPDRYKPWSGGSFTLIAPEQDLGKLSASLVKDEVLRLLKEERLK